MEFSYWYVFYLYLAGIPPYFVFCRREVLTIIADRDSGLTPSSARLMLVFFTSIWPLECALTLAIYAWEGLIPPPKAAEEIKEE